MGWASAPAANVLGVIVVAVNSSAYLAEDIFRAGASVHPAGPITGRRLLGMNGFRP